MSTTQTSWSTRTSSGGLQITAVTRGPVGPAAPFVGAADVGNMCVPPCRQAELGAVLMTLTAAVLTLPLVAPALGIRQAWPSFELAVFGTIRLRGV